MSIFLVFAMGDLITQIFAFSVADIGVPTWGRMVAAVPALWALMLTNGLEHAVAYNQSTGGSSFEVFGVGLHAIDLLQEWAYYLLAALAGVPLVAIAGASFSGRMLFQGPINLATTGDLWSEGKYFSVWGIRIPKVFSQKSGRIEQLVLGLILIACSFSAYLITH